MGIEEGVFGPVVSVEQAADHVARKALGKNESSCGFSLDLRGTCVALGSSAGSGRMNPPGRPHRGNPRLTPSVNLSLTMKLPALSSFPRRNFVARAGASC